MCWVGQGVGCVLSGSGSGVCVGWVMEWGVCWVGHGVGCVLGGSSSGVCVGWVMEWVGRVRGVRVVC